MMSARPRAALGVARTIAQMLRYILQPPTTTNPPQDTPRTTLCTTNIKVTTQPPTTEPNTQASTTRQNQTQAHTFPRKRRELTTNTTNAETTTVQVPLYTIPQTQRYNVMISAIAGIAAETKRHTRDHTALTRKTALRATTDNSIVHPEMFIPNDQLASGYAQEGHKIFCNYAEYRQTMYAMPCLDYNTDHADHPTRVHLLRLRTSY